MQRRWQERQRERKSGCDVCVMVMEREWWGSGLSECVFCGMWMAFRGLRAFFGLYGIGLMTRNHLRPVAVIFRCIEHSVSTGLYYKLYSYPAFGSLRRYSKVVCLFIAWRTVIKSISVHECCINAMWHL